MGPLSLIAALLDTRPLLWALAGDPRLPGWLGEEIERDPSCFGFSDASIWEIAIKRSTGKLSTPEHLPEIVADLGFTSVPITRQQAWAVRGLPFHHRDPFDRLLVAQAQDLAVPVVSADTVLASYAIDVRWAK